MKKNDIIYGNKYFYPGLNNKKYKINICDNKKSIINMINYFNNFLNNNNQNKMLGIDFEFNNIKNIRRIALCQLNFEDNTDNSQLFLFYPPDLNLKQTNTFINILTDFNITKILHGGESLDLPYLFENILKKREHVNNFFNNYIDTKFICDYYHLDKNKKNYKCKINYFNKEMKVISDKQFEYFQKEEEKLGPIYNILVDINKLNDLLILYTITDVLYLPELVRKFPKNIFYQRIIPEITSLSIISKINSKLFNNLKIKVYSFNNFYIKINNNRIVLSELYFNYLFSINDKELLNILEINYFKNFMDVILKSILYNELINNYYVWENKNKYIKKVNINITFINYKFNIEFNKILNNFRKEIKYLN